MFDKITTNIFALGFSLILMTTIFTTPIIPKSNAVEAPNGIRVVGQVKKPLNFTYAELLTFPLVSEVATLECVDYSWEITFNWTGVPLFHLLALAQVKQDAYDVVFRASDGFSSSIRVEEALRTTTILALKGNGTVLSEMHSIEGGFRIVIPGKWGYKWVRDIEEIEIVNYDYKGRYESAGFSDEADVPGSVQPLITPPLQVFEMSFGEKKVEMQAFTNVSVTLSSIDYFQRKLDFSIIAPSGVTGFADFIMPQNPLQGMHAVFLDGEIVDSAGAEAANLTLLYLAFPEDHHSVEIVYSGSVGIAPRVSVEFNQTAYVGEPVVFDASKSVDDEEIVTCYWDFGDGMSENNLVVSHSYVKEGTYKVLLRLTDNEGLSNSTELTVTIQNKLEPPESASQNDNSEKTMESLAIVGVVFAAVTIALTVTLVILFQKRKIIQRKLILRLKMDNIAVRQVFQATKVFFNMAKRISS
jgi:hypothetical protein